MLLDANVLIGAFRPEMPDHLATKKWLDDTMATGRAFGMVEGLLCGFVRIVTQKPFNPITPIDKALDFASRVRSVPSCRMLGPSPQQWTIFDDLCRRTRSQGRSVQDAYWASFALELDCEFITFDGGFARIPGLRWRSPLEGRARTNPR